MPHNNNPFILGNPVAPEQLIGRKKELRQIAGRIITGQSSIITGSPRSGKTSLLRSLSASEYAADYFGDEADKLIFSYWDACTCTPKFTLAQFWQRILKPLEEYIEAEHSNSQLAKAYYNCQKSAFDDYELEKLIAAIKKIDKRLILIMDEFDSLLGASPLEFSPLLSSAEFFGGLRTTFSRPDSPMVLIVTANISRSQLHEKTKQFSRMGSPYFNFAEEIILGALSEPEIDELLHQDNIIYFTDNDRCFIKEIAGGHPYLLKTAASILWETYEHDEKNELNLKRELYIKVADILDNIWKSWSQIMMDEQFTSLQKVFISVALVQIKKWKVNFKKHGINIDHIIGQFRSTNAELKQLENYGFLITDKNSEIGWRIYPSILLPFSIKKLEGYDDLKKLIIPKFFESP